MTEEVTYRDRLRSSYRGAFHEWALQVNRLQATAASQSGTGGVQEAEERAASAERAYRHTRNRLTEVMADDSAKANRCS